jgi:BMFP domain-containing protein YqiC
MRHVPRYTRNMHEELLQRIRDLEQRFAKVKEYL